MLSNSMIADDKLKEIAKGTTLGLERIATTHFKDEYLQNMNIVSNYYISTTQTAYYY